LAGLVSLKPQKGGENVKKWFITLIFVLGCLPVVAVKAAPPQTYIRLEYEVINGSYNVGDGNFEDWLGWLCSNKIQIPKNVNKLYFGGLITHFMLFFDGKTYIGYYYDYDYVYDLTWVAGAEEKLLGDYTFSDGFTFEIDIPTNATHIVLQSCLRPSDSGVEDYISPMPYYFSDDNLLIFCPVPTAAADNITFGLMPALMIVIVIAGAVGSLIMITKKSKR
jgi:hypothetical protein